MYGRRFVPGIGSQIPRVPVASQTQPITNQSVGLKFHNVRGSIDPGGAVFVPGSLEL